MVCSQLLSLNTLTAFTTGGPWAQRVLTTEETNILQAGLSRGHSASGPSKAATGAALQTSPSRVDPMEGQRAEVARTKRLRTRGDHELETDGPKTRDSERSDSEREAITNSKLD